MNFIDVLVILGVFTLLGSVKIHETKCKRDFVIAN